MSSRHIVVCGAGVVGLWTALQLRRSGHTVTVVERNPQQRDGCSYGNGGFVAPSHFVPLASPGSVTRALRWMLNASSPFYIRPRADGALIAWLWQFMRAANHAHVERSAPLLRDLLLASRAEYLELAARTANEISLETSGEVVLCSTPAALTQQAAVASMSRRLGVAAEVMSPERIAALDPGVTFNVAGGVYYGADCHLSPAQLMTVLSREASAAGVVFHWSEQVVGWRKLGASIRAMVTDRRELQAEEFVLAAGAWSPVVARDLGIHLPIEAGKGYSLTLPDPPQSPSVSLVLSEARAFISPQPGALRIGGTMELTGLNELIRPRRVQAIVDAVRRYLPGLASARFESLQPWVGLRPCSPDGLPLIGRVPQYRNLCMATGHAMLGVMLAPITGQLVSEIISGQPTAFVIDALRPDRFSRW